MIKLLKDELIEKEEGNLKICLHPISTSVQARLIELGRKQGIDKQIDYVQYCLRAVIKELHIDDVKLDPLEVAGKADLSDDETLASMIRIGYLVDKAVLLSEEEKKSLAQLQKPGDQEKNAKGAQDQ